MSRDCTPFCSESLENLKTPCKILFHLIDFHIKNKKRYWGIINLGNI